MTTTPVLCVTEWNGEPPQWLTPGAPLPLMGERHADPNIPGSGIVHYHCDWRYLDADSFAAAAYPSTHGWVGAIYPESAIAATEAQELPQLRPFPVWALDGLYGAAFDWFYALQDQFKDAHVDCNRCPHKGFDLSTVTPDEQGRKECPLHGLRWASDRALDYRDRVEADMLALFRYSYAELGAMMADRGLHVPSQYRAFQREIAEIHLERVRAQNQSEIERGVFGG